ncbi:acidic proline-rich protein PRP33-like [Pezoporus flaviventris]|uniref:acidic proline-rich protein PRP33-like n=1 Tax=Pezoporus flaviventris TaxID=889875 RepID=UPI002AB07093|nr:acidic proline-rich protein PRP33-like [Pezoporus flaviventris]
MGGAAAPASPIPSRGRAVPVRPVGRGRAAAGGEEEEEEKGDDDNDDGDGDDDKDEGIPAHGGQGCLPPRGRRATDPEAVGRARCPAPPVRRGAEGVPILARLCRCPPPLGSERARGRFGPSRCGGPMGNRRRAVATER